MADRKPYVLRRYDDGAYTVHDREKIGALLATHDGWEARPVIGYSIGRLVAYTRLRADAAERLWETRP